MVSAILLALVGLALSILFLIFLVICLPVELYLKIDTTNAPVAQARISLLGGLLPLPKTSGKKPKNVTARKDKSDHKKSQKSKMGKFNMQAMRSIPKLVYRLFRTVKIKRIKAVIAFGFDNPADTGMAYGMLTPIERGLGYSALRQISFHPDFNQAKLEGAGELQARFTPITVLPPIARFAWDVFVKPRFRSRSK